MAATDALAEGEAALERKAWAEAREAFARAVEQCAEPEAFEGLATAAFFLDDPQLVLEGRERAYTGYRRANRPVDAARVATALAWEYRVFRGDRAIGDGWLARAHRLLEGLPPTPEAGWLAIREASFALPSDPEASRRLCAEAEACGRELGEVDLEMTALALDGLALVSAGRIREGMARLDEATTAATAGEMQDPMAIGFSCCYLIFACERVRDFDRAGQWCERLSGMCEEWNIDSLLAVCRAHYGTVLVLRGDWARAETELGLAAAGLALRPANAAEALARLADLRRRQGRLEEAAALLAEIEHLPLAVLCGGAIALERGDVDGAVDAALRYLRMVGEARTDRAVGLELLAEAQQAAGRADEAAAAAAELRAIADAAGTEPLHAAARLADGRARAAADDADGARQAFEDAVELYGRARLPFEAGRARLALAAALRALGRGDAARRETGRAREAFAALGAAGEERRANAGTLTGRELEVLGLVARGQTNAEIARRLVLSEHTVHRHVANILAKLGCTSRAAAVRQAAEQGLL